MMAPPWLILDIRFPEFRNDFDVDPVDGIYKNGMGTHGHVVPGIIDIGNLLGTGSYEGTRMSEPEVRSNPVNGVDAIVTVLYQHRPSLLRQFLDSTDLTYIHSFDEKSYYKDEDQRKHFIISRSGDEVKAGFYEGHKPGRKADEWISYVRYTIIDESEWRQECLDYPDIDADKKRTIRCGKNEDRPRRLLFETWAAWALVPAIKQRRWFSQPGAKIEIKTNKSRQVVELKGVQSENTKEA